MLISPCACSARARTLAAFFLALIAATATAHARESVDFADELNTVARTEGVMPSLVIGSIDAAALRQRDAFDAKQSGDQRKDLRVAEGSAVDISADQDGVWLDFDDGSRSWMLSIEVPGASELHLGFDSFALPQGASLTLIPERDKRGAASYAGNDSGTLWPALLPGDVAALVLSLPKGAIWTPGSLRLSYVGAGYRHLFDAKEDLSLKSSSEECLVDVVCPIGETYSDPARAVTRYTYRRNGFTYLCTGSMVANTANDLRPLLLTAHHCVTNAAVAQTVVLYFNYESSVCGERQASLPGAHTGGAVLRATRADVDTSLLELNQVPAESLNVYYAGWDRSGEVPVGSIGIDHPQGRVKSIVENAAPLLTTNSCIMSGTQSTHWRTSAYVQGATRPGSSGSMLLVPDGDASGGGGLVTGVLSGGSSACSGSMPNQYGDCYGKLAQAWDGPDAGSRLKDWLDPLDLAPLRLQGREGPRPLDILNSGFEG
jgi:lysyl endopeptidase